MTENGKTAPEPHEYGMSMRWLLTAIILLAFHLPISPALAAATTQASSRAVEVSAGDGPGAIDAYVSALLETGEEYSLSDVRAAPLSAQFKPIETHTADFGYYTHGVWLKVAVRNISPETAELLLVLHTNFMRDMDVYYVVGDSVAHVLHQTVASEFSARTVKYHQLAASIDAPASSEGEIYVRYMSEGETVLPLSLESPLSFARSTNTRVTIDFAFYGIMAMFIAASLIGRLFWRNPTFIAYAFYAASVLLFIFQRDGYAFQYLWPQAPIWNNFSSLPVGASLPLFAALFTRTYLNTNKMHPVIDKILIGIVVMQICAVGAAWIIGAAGAKKLAVLTTTLSIVVLFAIGVAAYLKYGRRTLFFVIGWLGILCASIIMTLVHWGGVDVSRAQSLDVMRVSMVFDALMLGLASVVSVVDIQRDREKLSHERMAAMRTNLKLHNRLGRLEQKYHLAQTVAERTNQRLVDTTHDLRQPLYALRASLSEIGGGENTSPRATEIEQSLAYMEELVEAVFDKAMEEGEIASPPDSDGAEILKADKLFASLLTMFRADAEKNGVDLRVVPSSAFVRVAPFPALRILSNFVANAIRYAPGARIRIGARRRGARISFEVHDTGPGLDEVELDLVKERFRRGETAAGDDAGSGLGLSIVDALAKENRLEWSIKSRKGRGTVATLFVPIAES